MLTFTCLLPSGCLSKWLQVTAKPKIKMYVICSLSERFANFFPGEASSFNVHLKIQIWATLGNMTMISPYGSSKPVVVG